ncbi:MAG: SGNH/GDSL hydrolase family protein [Microcoleus sp. PH2017_25_DOB_D_A]|uniref:SGNH/GDSL hydrolase family protein n=1 Tax=unclassified Microcoleus TaxID=2642155 RepID=UPI001D78D29E|nr:MULTISPECIES: SGNH/GDSL hydrolase family protein [unclassified Microcoleus]MCC3431658.1 SGNH/GDSL hydrolase family protein [Microcoleus sp. PH2017_04_SCI_O_A]TAE05931.1 MAG: SGNH/GDSL hydrolase family protein [Oscillatoriales cyanobacterium]MCC3494191.1 SGNH/GDSL hydrolase family protein [Microcoleus sp. PH2017_16_JOR_D_A]MCC3537501.1 SGNH/GDSL hydrolase family protein [Microcoleus sp. PH2017_25_DOB_D_A]MCC3549744.1 SGNH/GDSL hydrolase family protein [Microcoleus sp. PH2017_24_DOB_U_A]
MKVVLIVLALTSGLWVAIEVLLRVLLGFGNPLIYMADDECGYLLAPNQRVRRLGNRIEINEYSMRTGSIAPTPTPETLRILLLGDSVANGGWWTDQTDTISEIMARQLSLQVQNLTSDSQSGAKVNYSDVEVLNASANSWGPRNQLAYAKRFGVFGAKVLVLLLNTDDLFASAPCAEVVGRDRSYPDRQPRSATLELLSRYLLPTLPARQLAPPAAESDVVGCNLEAIHQIQKIAVSANVKFLLAVTPKRGEFGDSGSRDWEIKARERLAELVEREKITYIDFLPIFNCAANCAAQISTLYRDSIHLSPQGNQLVSKTISRQIVAVFLPKL